MMMSSFENAALANVIQAALRAFKLAKDYVISLRHSQFTGIHSSSPVSFLYCWSSTDWVEQYTEYKRWGGCSLQHWLGKEVIVKKPQKCQLSGRNGVYLSMDSPHCNYPLLKASSVGVRCSAHRRKLINDSGYFLQYQTPFKGDAMTVAWISCCVQVLLVI